ncbi:hypothetical protein L2E82_05982 [Cichorium intybus]|uniref:Uncharacterized protein n=1 Tax=Cichorium intybus TaxID=13427 RepID=A0ACB9H8R9_CICIN|nr:hypothetical protein L2E82_05982 [Cichorium intybus]
MLITSLGLGKACVGTYGLLGMSFDTSNHLHNTPRLYLAPRDIHVKKENIRVENLVYFNLSWACFKSSNSRAISRIWTNEN